MGILNGLNELLEELDSDYEETLDKKLDTFIGHNLNNGVMLPLLSAVSDEIPNLNTKLTLEQILRLFSIFEASHKNSFDATKCPDINWAKKLNPKIDELGIPSDIESKLTDATREKVVAAAKGLYTKELASMLINHWLENFLTEIETKFADDDLELIYLPHKKHGNFWENFSVLNTGSFKLVGSTEFFNKMLKDVFSEEELEQIISRDYLVDKDLKAIWKYLNKLIKDNGIMLSIPEKDAIESTTASDSDWHSYLSYALRK